MRLTMGIDPGSRATGWGIIKCEDVHREFVDCGTVLLTSPDLSLRLVQLYQELQVLIKKYQPDDVVVERIFLGKNIDSAFKLGHARGVCLMVAAQSGTTLYEYAPRRVKQVVTGMGSASKDYVQEMIRRELKIAQNIKHDASDALALAMCHALELNSLIKMQRLHKEL